MQLRRAYDTKKRDICIQQVTMTSVTYQPSAVCTVYAVRGRNMQINSNSNSNTHEFYHYFPFCRFDRSLMCMVYFIRQNVCMRACSRAHTLSLSSNSFCAIVNAVCILVDIE